MSDIAPPSLHSHPHTWEMIKGQSAFGTHRPSLRFGGQAVHHSCGLWSWRPCPGREGLECPKSKQALTQRGWFQMGCAGGEMWGRVGLSSEPKATWRFEDLRTPWEEQWVWLRAVSGMDLGTAGNSQNCSSGTGESGSARRGQSMTGASSCSSPHLRVPDSERGGSSQGEGWTPGAIGIWGP